MPGHRYRFVLVDESAELPVLYGRTIGHSPRAGDRAAVQAAGMTAPASVDPIAAIIEAFSVLDVRGAGERAWAVPLAGNPLGFLLDSLGDAVFVRDAAGRLLFRNRAAQEIEPVARPPVPAETLRLGSRVYERRCLVVEHGQGRLVLEVMHGLVQDLRQEKPSGGTAEAQGPGSAPVQSFE